MNLSDYRKLRKQRRLERLSASVFLLLAIGSVGILLISKSRILPILGVVPSAIATLRFKALEEDGDVFAAEKAAALALKRKELDKALFSSSGQAAIALEQVQNEQPELSFYNWEDAIDEGVGFIITGSSGSGKTSVACWLAGLLTKDNPSQVLALDPHFNDTWELIGVNAVGKIQEIERLLLWFISELDRRLELKRTKQDMGDQVIVFCDEIGSCLDRFEDPKVVNKAIKRLGSEGRKFGLIFIILNQSPNATDLDISAQYLNNYFQIALRTAAASIAETTWKKTDPRNVWIESQPYACLVSRTVPTQLAIHPTHHSYKKYKKQGNPPKNLTQIKQLPLTIPVANGDPIEAIQDKECSPVVEKRNPDHEGQSCPHCGSYDIKWLSQNVMRKQCKDCNKTWSVK